MHIRNAIAAVSVTAVAVALSACSTQADPTSDAPAAAGAPAATASDSPTPAVTHAAAGTIRPVQPGYKLDSVAKTLRDGFSGFADKSDDDIATILNAACDAMDESGTPTAGADAIKNFGIDAYDAAFSVSAAVSLYCPEYTSFIDGSQG